MRLDSEEDEIEIGVPDYQRPEDVTLGSITALPFRERRNDWVALDETPHKSRASSAAERHDSLQDQ